MSIDSQTNSEIYDNVPTDLHHLTELLLGLVEHACTAQTSLTSKRLWSWTTTKHLPYMRPGISDTRVEYVHISRGPTLEAAQSAHTIVSLKREDLDEWMQMHKEGAQGNREQHLRAMRHSVHTMVKTTGWIFATARQDLEHSERVPGEVYLVGLKQTAVPFEPQPFIRNILKTLDPAGNEHFNPENTAFFNRREDKRQQKHEETQASLRELYEADPEYTHKTRRYARIKRDFGLSRDNGWADKTIERALWIAQRVEVRLNRQFKERAPADAKSTKGRPRKIKRSTKHIIGLIELTEHAHVQSAWLNQPSDACCVKGGLYQVARINPVFHDASWGRFVQVPRRSLHECTAVEYTTYLTLISERAYNRQSPSHVQMRCQEFARRSGSAPPSRRIGSRARRRINRTLTALMAVGLVTSFVPLEPTDREMTVGLVQRFEPKAPPS